MHDFESMSRYQIEVQLHILLGGCKNSDETPRYLSSWSDIGPLIVEHGISILQFNDDDDEPCLSCIGPIAEDGHSVGGEYIAWSKNPLRAAAITLIKKLEAENASGKQSTPLEQIEHAHYVESTVLIKHGIERGDL